MKTLLTFALLLFVSLNSFGQKEMTEREQWEAWRKSRLEKKSIKSPSTQDERLQLQNMQTYTEYVKFCNEHSITPKTETAWIYDVFYLADYRLEQDFQNLNSKIFTSGTYLIKARNQILEGIACGIVAGGVAYIGSTTYTNAVNSPTYRYELYIAKRNRNITYIGAGILSLAGLGLEISGIINIGRAGISLKGNGVGVKVKF